MKVGYTAKDVEQRVREQFPVLQPEEKPYKIEFAESAMRDDGTFFLDHPVHDWLEAHGCENINGEWYRCTPDQVRAGWIAVRDRTENDEARDRDFSMRPEQAEAVRSSRSRYLTGLTPTSRRPRLTGIQRTAITRTHRSRAWSCSPTRCLRRSSASR